MSYVLHVYRMTYKTYGIQDYIFVYPEEWFSMPPFFGSLFVSSFGHNENEPFLGGFAPPATWANHRSVFNGIDLFFPKHCVHKDTARYVLSYSKPFELLTKNCLIIGNSSPKSLYLDNNQNDTREYKNK